MSPSISVLLYFSVARGSGDILSGSGGADIIIIIIISVELILLSICNNSS